MEGRRDRPKACCIRCGAAMSERGCKVRCPVCHLFYDCSDGMLPMPEQALSDRRPEAEDS